MADPKSMEEYSARFAANHRVEGFGLDVRTVMPCPFCAAPDWMVMPIMGVREAMEKGATCKECGRSARSLFAERPGEITFEIVQTGGDDPPDWLPKIRRGT